MQALSTGPLKGGLFVAPQSDVEVGFNCFSRISVRKGRNRRCLAHNAFFGQNSSPLLVSCNSSYFPSRACCKSSSVDVKIGFLSKCAKLQGAVLSGPKKGSFGSSFALAWALKERAVGDEFQRVESSSHDELSRTGAGDADCHHLERSEDSDESGDEKGTEKLDYGNEGGEVGEEECAMIDVRALAHSLYCAKTVDDVEEVLKDKGELSLRVYTSVIWGLGLSKKMEPALAVVGWLKRKKNETGGAVGPNIFIYNSLLSAVKQCGRYTEADKIMNEMTQEGVVPNVVTYNTMMIIYIHQGRADEAVHKLDEMQKKGIAPTAASYYAALLAFRKLEDANGALEFFTEINGKYQKGKGEIGENSDENWGKEFVRLEDFTIRVCYQVMRRWLTRYENTSTKVLKLLICMDKAGLHPSRAQYERLLWACTNEEHYSVAKELYARIREKHSEISLSVCNHVIWLMGKAKKWWAALEIYEDLLDKGPEPNNVSYELIISYFNILLTAAQKRGIWRWGVRLLNKMEERGLKPGSKGWNAVLLACSKASETSAAVEIFKRMVGQGEKPTNVSYGALLSALEKGKLYDEAIRVWEHMHKVGVPANLYSYTIMVSVFAGLGKFSMIDDLVHDMTSAGIEPTVVTYNAIVTGCARNGMSNTAYEWFNHMKVQNITPNEITYEMLIEGLAKDGKPELAYESYLSARNDGLNLSSRAYDAVVHSSHEQETAIDLTALGPRPLDKKKKVVIRKTLTEFCRFADVRRRSTPFDRKEIYSSRTNGNQ